MTAEDQLETTLRNGEPLKMCSEYNYLGTWISDNGKCLLNIEKKIEKCQNALNKVETIASEERIGKLTAAIKNKLYSTIIIPILLYNIEAWGIITKTEISLLEQYQAQTIKRLYNLPQSTSSLGLLYELGIWRIKYIIFYKKMMLLHNILNSNAERLTKRIILDQHQYPTPNCWLQVLKREAADINVKVDIEQIKSTTKPVYKKSIKQCIQKILVDEIRANATTKMRTVIKGEFGNKRYIDDGQICFSDVSLAMQIRLHMTQQACNYGAKTNSCQFCFDEMETTEHMLLHCKTLQYLRSDIDILGLDLEKTDTESVRKLVKIHKRIDKVMIKMTSQ